MSDSFLPIFKGWNVWVVWQSKDLDFDPLMIGVSRDRRLRIFVEDAVRLGSADADVADPLDLKGGQVEILPAIPRGLATAKTKEQLAGDRALTIDGPAEERVVRFFNRGNATHILWPHDNNHLVDRVLIPSPDNPATSGTAPPRIGSEVTEPLKSAGKGIAVVAGVAVAGVLLVAILSKGSSR